MDLRYLDEEIDFLESVSDLTDLAADRLKEYKYIKKAFDNAEEYAKLCVICNAQGLPLITFESFK